MTVTDQPITTEVRCVCGCPKWDHKQGRAACKHCGCETYDPAIDPDVTKLRAEVDHLREQNVLLREVNVERGRAEAENERLNRAITVLAGERDTARAEVQEQGNELAEVREERDEYEEAIHATRQMAIQANAALRVQLLEALGQQDDDRTPLSGYVAALVCELVKARAHLADAEYALVEANGARRLSNAEHLHQRLAAAALVIGRWQDWRHCPMCLHLGPTGGLHGCGPLIPVDVIIARRPNPPTTEEQP